MWSAIRSKYKEIEKQPAGHRPGSMKSYDADVRRKAATWRTAKERLGPQVFDNEKKGQ